MANRRMFSKDVIDSDRFLDMPPTTQNLYFHLGMQADDDGFVASPKKVARNATAGADDLKLLEAKGFIISFASGVIVITDWKLNNQIRADRRKETIYLEEKKHLSITEQLTYIFVETPLEQGFDDIPTSRQLNGNQLTTNRQPTDDILATQYSIEQDRSVKDRLVQQRTVQQRANKPSLEAPAAGLLDSIFTIEDCMLLYQECFGEISKIDCNSLRRLATDHSADFLYNAIERTNNRENILSPLAVITAILRDWKSKGFTSFQDICDEQAAFNWKCSKLQ